MPGKCDSCVADACAEREILAKSNQPVVTCTAYKPGALQSTSNAELIEALKKENRELVEEISRLRMDLAAKCPVPKKRGRPRKTS